MMKRLAVIGLALFFALYSLLPAAFAEEKKAQTQELAEEAKSAVLIERDTGAVLYDKNSHEPLPPASMTKIMTMVLILEAIDEGKLDWKEKIRTSEKAASMGGSQIFLEPGEEMTVEEMLRGIAIGSANDASVAMAERIAGSEEEFVNMMNTKVKELGLKNTTFKNATGLPAEGHVSSAYDMAMIGKELLKHKEITRFTGMYESYLRENTEKKFWLVNTNRLVKFYPGVDGLKTGFTNEAKYCLTATAEKNDMRVIAVVFGASTPKTRNAQVTKMLDYAFNQYQTHPLYKRGEKVGEIKVSKGDKNEVEVQTGESVSILTKRGEKSDDYDKQVKLKEKIKAPIMKGDKVGELIIKKDGKVLSKTPLVAKNTVKEAGWWQFYKKSFNLFSKTGN